MYRRLRHRVRGSDGRHLEDVVIAIGYATVWAGLATIELDDDDGCGRPAPVVWGPPPPIASAMADLPWAAERDPVSCAAPRPSPTVRAGRAED